MSKITITTTKIFNITNVAVDFVEFTLSWMRIRNNAKYKGFDCFKCHRDFKIGEKISLIFTDKGNRVVCHECGEKIKAELEAQK